MKKIIGILALLLLGLQGQSQILITLLLGDKLNSDKLEFGLEGGFNWSNISGMDANRALGTFNLGFYFDIRLKEQWFLYTGVLVKSNLGVAQLSDNDLLTIGASNYKSIDDSITLTGDYSQKMSYFLVPALIKYKFKNNFYAMAGPQFGLMYKSWVQFDSDIEGRDATIKEYNREIINKFDVGAMAGIGYTMWQGTGWTIGVKYYYGFVNVYKNIHGTKNNSLFVHLNIPIGAGENPNKKKKKE